MFWSRGAYSFVPWTVDLSNMSLGKRWSTRRSVIAVACARLDVCLGSLSCMNRWSGSLFLINGTSVVSSTLQKRSASMMPSKMQVLGTPWRLIPPPDMNFERMLRFRLSLGRFVRHLACVASVSVGFGSKERPRNGIFGVLSARKMGREPKKRRRWVGEGKEGNTCRQTPGF